MSAMLIAAVSPGAMDFASAQAVNPANRNILVQQNQFQMLENRFQRQLYQQRQQQFRAQDRQVAPPQQPIVPQMKPSCHAQIIGTAVITHCR